ncbi:MAG: alanine dehydrogenase [Clostridia bacterium]|nr:alanine dehydrogenase [Clostridia bacterium]
MKIGVVKELKDNEYRVGAIPTGVAELVARGNEVIVETKAGVGSGFSDEDYEKAGAKVVATAEEVWTNVDMIYKVKEIFPEEFKYLRDDIIIFTYIHSNAHPEQTDALLDSHCTSIAYEDIDDDNGKFPLLAPMSELAGRGGFLAALHFQQTMFGGPGKLLCNVAGAPAPVITMLGCGVIGTAICEMASAWGCKVNMLDVNYATMLKLKERFPSANFIFSNRTNLQKVLPETDVVFNGILWPKDRKDHVLYREDLKLMKPGAMIVDVACDDNGAVETCRSTTHADPIYFEEGIMHYAVDNIPAAFAQTASTTLCMATLPHAIAIAKKGVKQALKDDKHLRRGLTSFDGKLCLLETALKQNRVFTDPNELVKEF